MILHITFRDGSNPYVSYGGPEKIRAAWKQWEKNPDAIPEIHADYFRITRQIHGDRWTVYHSRTGRYRYYTRLGNALRHAARVNAETRNYSVFLNSANAKYRYMNAARVAGAYITDVSGCGTGYHISIDATPAQVEKIERKLEVL